MENLDKEILKNCEEKITEFIEDKNFSVAHSISSVLSSKASLTKTCPENEELVHVLEDLEDKIGTTEYDIDSWNAGVKNDLIVFSKYLENTARIQSFLSCKELEELLEKRTKLHEEMISNKLCYNDSKIHHSKTIQKYNEISKHLKEHSWLDNEKIISKSKKLNEEIESHKLHYKFLTEGMKNLRKWDKKWIDNINKCMISPNTKTMKNLINGWLKCVNKINKSLDKDILAIKKKISKKDKETENIQKKITTLLNPTGLKVRYSVTEENQIVQQVLEEGKFKPCYEDEKCDGEMTKFFKSLVDNDKENDSAADNFQFTGLKTVRTREKSDLQRDMNNILKVIDELQIEPMTTENFDIFEIDPEILPSQITKNEEVNSLLEIDKQEDGNEFLTLIKKIDNIETSFAEIKQKLVSTIDETSEKSENLRHINYFCEKFKELMQLQERYNCEVYKKVDLLQQENNSLSEGLNINLDRINYELRTIKQKLENLSKEIENLERENNSKMLEVKTEIGELKNFTENNTQSISELKKEFNFAKIHIEDKLELLKNEFQLMRDNKINQEISENKSIQTELNCLKKSTEKYTSIMNDQLRSLEKNQQKLQETLESDNLKNKICELSQYCERIEGELRSHLGQLVDHKGDDLLVTSLKLPWDLADTRARSMSDTVRALLSHRAMFSQVPNCTILHQLREHQAENFCKSKHNSDLRSQERKPSWKP